MTLRIEDDEGFIKAYMAYMDDTSEIMCSTYLGHSRSVARTSALREAGSDLALDEVG